MFPAGTDVKVKERDGKLYAPGISDDTRGLAVLLSWLKVLNDNKVQTVGDLLFVGNVGEEELGNLRGMKRIFAEHLDIDGMVGLEPAPDGGVLVLGTGSHRYEVTFKGPGGHSYAAFGQVPSAIHGMGRAIAKIADIQTPGVSENHFHGRHGRRRHLGQHHRAGRAHGDRHPLGRHGRAAGDREEDPGRDRRARGGREQALEREHAERVEQADRRPARAAARRPTP